MAGGFFYWVFRDKKESLNLPGVVSMRARNSLMKC